MKVLIGADPHKSSVAVAAVNEVGELVECASFPQNRAGLRALERWAKRFAERRWAVENAGGLGKHLSQRLAAAGELVVDVPPKLSARVRVLSTGNSRKNDGLDAFATALAAWRNERLPTVDPEAGSEVLRLLSERRYRLGGQAYPRALNRLHGLLRDLVLPAECPERSRPTEPRAWCAAYGHKAFRPASAVDWLRRSCATLGH